MENHTNLLFLPRPILTSGTTALICHAASTHSVGDKNQFPPPSPTPDSLPRSLNSGRPDINSTLCVRACASKCANGWV